MILALMLAASAPAFAQHEGAETGNGGDGLYINGQLYSLDLIEAGVQAAPLFDTSMTPDPVLLERLRVALQSLSLSEATLGLLASKLTEIEPMNRGLVIAMMRAFEEFSWSRLAAPLADIHDDSSVVAPPPHGFVQIALRQHFRVMIDGRAFGQLNPANQAALLSHEAIFIIQQLPREGSGVERRQSSVLARELNGYLYTRQLQRDGVDGLNRYTNTYEYPLWRYYSDHPQRVSEYHHWWHSGRFITQDPFLRGRVYWRDSETDLTRMYMYPREYTVGRPSHPPRVDDEIRIACSPGVFQLSSSERAVVGGSARTVIELGGWCESTQAQRNEYVMDGSTQGYISLQHSDYCPGIREADATHSDDAYVVEYHEILGASPQEKSRNCEAIVRDYFTRMDRDVWPALFR